MTDEEQEDGHNKKTVNFYVVLHWKNEDVKLRKTKPKKSELSPYEVPIEQELTFKLPSRDKIKATGEIELSREKVKEMTVEAL